LLSASFIGSLYKNSILYLFVSFASKNKPYLQEIPTQSLNLPYFVCGTIVDVLTHFGMNILCKNIKISPLFFLPYLFLFELLFDFFHYWTHRLSHKYAFLYSFHRLHHSSHPIHISTTFQHHPIDLLFTNTLPLLLCVTCIPSSPKFITAVLWYKTIQEIAGYTGRDLSGSSFVACIWLPRILTIELYSRDHTLHHSMPMCNF
jgi:sterol desaturase/sphingolipid hydroxylase (fatty acid hydroxylase superfamily)